MLKFNNKVMKFGNYWGTSGSVIPPVDPYNPLGLPANTVRVRTSDGNAPIKGYNTRYETATLVSGTTDVYDLYKRGNDFVYFLNQSSNVVEVLGANTTNITDMDYMFSDCISLTSVSLFDTSSVTDMHHMFNNCTSLASVPLFDTSSVTNMSTMLYNCISLTLVPLFDTSACTNMDYMLTRCSNVESGALALYQQASSQASVPSHSITFTQCGKDTVTGAAELAQIPTSWGGTAT